MSYQAPGIYPQKPQPTAPTRRARYQKDDTNWIGIPYKQWDWVVLTRDIGTVFRNGELVCLLDVAPVRISPTERPGQSNQWQRMDFDTQYRIGKYVKETMTRFALCQDKTGSISHMHLSDRSKGSPVKRFLRQGEVVYLLPTYGNRTVPTYYVTYEGATLPIPPQAAGRIVQSTSRKVGASGAKVRTGAPDDVSANMAEREYYLVEFPVESTTYSWVECNVSIPDAYFRRAVPSDKAGDKEKEVNSSPPAPRVLANSLGLLDRPPAPQASTSTLGVAAGRRPAA